MTEVLINGSQGKLQGFYKHSENSKNIFFEKKYNTYNK